MQELLIDLHYLGSVWYFQELLKQPIVRLEACENYRKSSYRNRCHIAGANGLLRLSVPLAKGKFQRKPYPEVEISYTTRWQHQHWQSIRSAYGNSPYFEHYAEEIEAFYLKPFHSLFDFNFQLLECITELLSFEIEFKKTTEFTLETPEGFRDLRNVILPKTPLENPKEYPQLFQDKNGFIPNLSILDLLFCCGPETILLLETDH